jgi:hypothetical protein
VLRMKLKSQGYECVYVKEVSHGKSVRSSRTISLVRTGASGPSESIGSPVIGSSIILGLCFGPLAGVSTMRPASTLASSASPARIPSLRRSGTGSTTCPLVETRVCMVRQSYLRSSDYSTREVPGDVAGQDSDHPRNAMAMWLTRKAATQARTSM